MTLLRAVAGRSYTLTKTLYSGSTATDPTPDIATATATRWSDGTAVDPVVSDAGVGKVALTWTPAQLATLDRLTVITQAAFGGQTQTYRDYLEVCGGVYFTIAEARAAGVSSSRSDEDIAAMRT